MPFVFLVSGKQLQLSKKVKLFWDFSSGRLCISNAGNMCLIHGQGTNNNKKVKHQSTLFDNLLNKCEELEHYIQCTYFPLNIIVISVGF